MTTYPPHPSTTADWRHCAECNTYWTGTHACTYKGGAPVNPPNEMVSVRADDVRAVLSWPEVKRCIGLDMHDRLVAAVTPPPPAYEPSEQDIDAYCEAHAWHWKDKAVRSGARQRIFDARSLGFDVVPRRLTPEGET